MFDVKTMQSSDLVILGIAILVLGFGLGIIITVLMPVRKGEDYYSRQEEKDYKMTYNKRPRRPGFAKKARKALSSSDLMRALTTFSKR